MQIRKNTFMKIGFDNEKYLQMQSEHIRDRISKFDNKLYLEFGGKLFDDYHAARVLPGFAPDSKLKLLMQLSDQAEIVIVISAGDIEKNKVRGDLGITYDIDVLRLMDSFKEQGLYVGSVVITQYSGQPSANAFKSRLEKLKIKVYTHYNIEGYPSPEFMDMVLKVKPEQVTLVPDAPDAITSNAGWDVEAKLEFLTGIVDRLRDAGIRSSIFVGTDVENIK